MTVLFIASELTPIAKIGGLGDVVGSLPKALAKLGIDVKIIIPKYEQIKEEQYPVKLVLADFFVTINNKTKKINLYKTFLTGTEIEVFLVENQEYLSIGPIYFERAAFKEFQRFLFFSRAVFELLRDKNEIFFGGRHTTTLPLPPTGEGRYYPVAEKRYDAFPPTAEGARGRVRADISEIPEPQIIHCHDWHTGVLINFLKHNLPKTKVIFTIHNLDIQGKWNVAEIASWFGENNFTRFGDDFNLIAEGILNADLITTVSPTYSKEILTKEYGLGLEDLLEKRQKNLVGILNGIDYDFWPKQKKDKSILQKKLGLKIDPSRPLFGLVARLTHQKGIGLLLPLISKLVEGQTPGAQFVFLGQGEERYEIELKKLNVLYPESVAVKIGFDEELSHLIYSHSDFFLMPSIFEPCGLGQMIAMHYGAIPIVRATGGLKDTVINYSTHSSIKKATGFVFKKSDSTSLEKTIQRALKIYHQKAVWEQLIKNCMTQNFSWEKSGQKYLEIYKRMNS